MFFVKLDSEISFVNESDSGIGVIYDTSIEFGSDKKRITAMHKKAKSAYSEIKAMYSVYCAYENDSDNMGGIVNEIYTVLDSSIDDQDIKRKAAELLARMNGTIRKPKRSPLLKPGYVYLMKSENSKYKIGISSNIPSRMKHLATVTPYPIELIHYFYSPDTYSAERALHEKYSSVRVEGEWFNLTPDQVKEVCSISGDPK